MKAPDFAYVQPASLDEAIGLLAEIGEGAVPLAGGQSLLTTLNMRLSAPEVLVDIGGLEELRGIEQVDDAIRIGSSTRHVDVQRSNIIAEHLPLISDAMAHVAHVGIRNRGTFGGSLANADPAAEMPACAVALGATLVLAGPDGRREIAAEDFYKGLFETDRAPDEILVEARVPVQPAAQVSAFDELSRRSGDFAVAGLAAVGQVESGSFSDLRLVYLGCDDGPRLAARTAALIVAQGLTVDDAALVAALRADQEYSDVPGLSAATKCRLAAVLTRRVLARLHGDMA
jgi:carbon-monoxide dehydrogenase medium subunit